MSAGRGRLPLIAGNWKMHYNHLEGLALVQKLVAQYPQSDYAARAQTLNFLLEQNVPTYGNVTE